MSSGGGRGEDARRSSWRARRSLRGRRAVRGCQRGAGPWRCWRGRWRASGTPCRSRKWPGSRGASNCRRRGQAWWAGSTAGARGSVSRDKCPDGVRLGRTSQEEEVEGGREERKRPGHGNAPLQCRHGAKTSPRARSGQTRLAWSCPQRRSMTTGSSRDSAHASRPARRAVYLERKRVSSPPAPPPPSQVCPSHPRGHVDLERTSTTGTQDGQARRD